MKYVSKNCLHDFEFHDAEISLVSVTDDCLTLEVEYLNIHSDAIQNPFETDMEIKRAILVFEGFNAESYEIGRAWKKNIKGEYYTDEPQIIFYADEAKRRFLNQLIPQVRVFYFGVNDENMYYMDGVGDDPFFMLHFYFDNVTVMWDEYKKEAWYTQMNN